MRKVVMRLALSALVIFFVSTISFSQTPVVVSSTYRGDINEDGQVNIFDLLEMLKMLGSMEGKTERQRQIADIDADDTVNIFDLLGLLKVISGAEPPGIIQWGPAVTGVDPAIAGVGDTVTVYCENFSEDVTSGDIKALLNNLEAVLLEFSRDSLKIIVPEGFTGGDLSLIVVSDTTNSIFIQYMVKVVGTVEQISGLDMTSLKVVSPMAEEAVQSDGSFHVKFSDSVETSFAAAVNQSGNPVLLSFMTYLPETGLMSVKRKDGQVLLAAIEDLSLGTQSTALSMVMLNPVLFGSSASQRKDFADMVLQHSRFQELFAGVNNILAADPNSNYLVDESHPELFELANEIALDVFDSMASQGILQGVIPDIFDRPPPSIQPGNSGSQIKLVNPFYIDMYAGLYSYGSTPDRPDSYRMHERSRLWGFIPYVGDDYGEDEINVTPGISLAIDIYSGFDTEYDYWLDPAWPQGKATWLNGLHIVVDIIDLVIHIPGINEKLGLLVDLAGDFEGGEALGEAIQAGEIVGVLKAAIGLIDQNKDIIMVKIFTNSSTKVYNYSKVIYKIVGNVALPLKILSVANKLPFYNDLLCAPDKTTYHFRYQSGQVVSIYTLSGRILEDGSGLSEVTVRITGNGVDNTVVTGSDGSYRFTGLSNGTYTITPSKSGYTFCPDSLQVTISSSDVIASTITTTVVYGITFVSIPGGTFQMGSTTGYSNEQPVHQVTVSAFQIGRYEITQAQYQAMMGTNPSRFTGDLNRPAEQVSWYDAVIFCNKLSESAGLQPCYNLSTFACDFTKSGFRLPTEAEWEYACRAGTATKYYTGDATSDLKRAGWYISNSGNTTHPVGQKEANAFGLYDMHGNVREWCNDYYFSIYYSQSENATNPQGPQTGSYRVLRGGSWDNYDRYCRSANRHTDYPYYRHYTIGFRVIRGAISPGLQ